MLGAGQFIVDCYRAAGLKAEIFKLGFEHTILDLVPEPQQRAGEAVFIGSIALRPYAHMARLSVLASVADEPRLKLHVHAPSPRNLWTHGIKLLLEHKWPEIVSYSTNMTRIQHVRRANRGPVYGLEMYAKLAASEICLNVHIDASRNTAGNMRLFEATGMGCCLLTDEKNNLGELFEIDREVVTFRSPEECAEKLDYLLNHPGECRQIGRAGQQRTLRDYRLDTQIHQVAKILMELVS